MSIFDDALSGLGLTRAHQIPEVSPQVETKAADLTTGAGAWFEIFGQGTKNNQFTQFNNMKQQMAAYNDWVYAAAHTIAEQCAAIDLRIFMNRSKRKNAQVSDKMMYDKKTIYKMEHQKTTEIVNVKGKLVRKDNLPQLEELESHPLLDLLNAPNPFMTRNEFFELTFLHMELTGNAYWAIERDNKGKPAALWPLLPEFVSVVPDKEKFIIGYIYKVNNEEVPFAPDDIIHHKYMNPSDLRMGMSTVQAAARAIDTDAHAADYNRKFFYNSAQPDAVLYTDAQLDEKMYKRLVSQWRDTYGGTANSHRTAILENGLKYQARVLTQKDMDWLNGRNFNRDQILAIFGVPKSIIGLDESMSRANAETAEYVFVKGKIRPKMLRLCARITEDLAIQFDKKLVVSFTDPVPSDKAFLLEEKKASVNTWRTINEVRAEDGDDPVPGGDELYIANTLHPIGQEMEEPAPEETPAVAEEDPRDPDGENENPDEKPTEPSNVSSAGDAGSTTGTAGQADKALISKKKESLEIKKAVTKTQAFDDVRNSLCDTFETQFCRAARTVFLEQKKEVLNNLRDRFIQKGYKPTKRKMTQQQKQDINDLFNDAAATAAWVAAFDSIYRQAVQQMGSQALDYVITEANAAGLQAAVTVYDDSRTGIQKFYDQRETKVSASIDEETDKQLKTSLAEGIDAGETVAELADRVENIYGAAAGYRAERIARTESIMSTTFATRDAWRISGVVQNQQWLTAGDPCPFCADMDGKTLGLNDSEAYFRVGDSITTDDGQTMSFKYQDISGPPLHVNCRCSLIPVLFPV